MTGGNVYELHGQVMARVADAAVRVAGATAGALECAR
jgi:hypothetical protein